MDKKKITWIIILIFFAISLFIVFDNWEIVPEHNKENGNNSNKLQINGMTQSEQAKVYYIKDTNTGRDVELEDLGKDYDRAIIRTNFGDITVKFYYQDSPNTVNNFLNLAKQGFYNGTRFHRIIKGFMIQGGCPLSKDMIWDDDGTGGPGYHFMDEINEYKLMRGSLAMANSGPDTNGSQFFIVTQKATPWLDGLHTNFGYVITGMEVVDKIENLPVNDWYNPWNSIVIESVELISR
jgi:cyclophilin family peptidyl-prolyl cis-trans isomerase